MAGLVRVRWVGHPSAFDDPGVLRRLATGRLSLGTVGELRRYDRLRVGLVPGSSVRTLTPGDGSGVMASYRFVPATEDNTSGPFQLMTTADATVLFANRWDRWEFLDATEPPILSRRPMTGRDWERLLEDFRLVERTTDARQRPANGKQVVPVQLTRPYR